MSIRTGIRALSSRRPIGPLLALLLLGGCLIPPRAVTNVALTDPSVRYAPSPTVQLLERLPTRPHQRIALLETLGNEAVTSEVFMLENMRRMAARIGADAIVVQRDSAPYVRGASGEVWVMNGIAIRYLPQPGAAQGNQQ